MHCFRAAYLTVAVHGWTVRYETPPVRSDSLILLESFSCLGALPEHFGRCSFLLNFSTGFIETLFAILISASLVWGACTLYVLVVHLLGLPANTIDRTGELTLEPNG